MNVKELREKLNLTPEQMAAKLGVSTRSVLRWEAGKKPSRMALKLLEHWERKVNK